MEPSRPIISMPYRLLKGTSHRQRRNQRCVRRGRSLGALRYEPEGQADQLPAAVLGRDGPDELMAFGIDRRDGLVLGYGDHHLQVVRMHVAHKSLSGHADPVQRLMGSPTLPPTVAHQLGR